RLGEDQLITERPDIVDLLLEEGTRELVVDRETVAIGLIWAGGVPERRIEDNHRAGWTLDGNRSVVEVRLGRALGPLMRRGDHERSAVGRCELIQREHYVDRGHVAVQMPWKIAVEGMLEACSGGWLL